MFDLDAVSVIFDNPERLTAGLVETAFLLTNIVFFLFFFENLKSFADMRFRQKPKRQSSHLQTDLCSLWVVSNGGRSQVWYFLLLFCC